jgi:hypothetical protein
MLGKWLFSVRTPTKDVRGKSVPAPFAITSTSNEGGALTSANRQDTFVLSAGCVGRTTNGLSAA